MNTIINNQIQTIMYVLAHLAFRSYDPEEIKLGMLFMDTRADRVIELNNEFALKSKGKEGLIAHLGYPVQVYVVDDDNNVLAEPHEVGLWDVNDDTHGYREIGVREYNHLIQEWDGMVEIQCIDVDPMSGLPPMPAMVTGKVVLRSPVEEEETGEESDDG